MNIERGSIKSFRCEDGPQTSLDSYGQDRTFVADDRFCSIDKPQWSRKQKRAFVKAKMGERSHKGEDQRFMTLTSSDSAQEEIGIDFRVLTLRIRRLTPYKLYKKGYITEAQIRRYYPNKNLHAHLRFDYFRVRTNEGNGVLHILYYGDYIPQKWLSDSWDSIHQSPIVDIRVTKDSYIKYVVTQYCCTQSHFVSSSFGKGWMFKGCMRIWDWARRFMSLDRRISLMDVLQSCGWADVVHKGRRYVLHAGHPPPPSPVVFLGKFNPGIGKMEGDWVDRSEVKLDPFGCWVMKHEENRAL